MNYFRIFTGLLLFVVFYSCTLAQSIVWSHEGAGISMRNTTGKRYLVADKYDTLYMVTSIDKGSGYDIMLYKYDNNGTPIWTRRYNSGNQDISCGSLILDYQNNICVMGMSHVAVNRDDCVLLKYDRNGNIIWTRIQDSTNTHYSPVAMEQDQSGNLVVLCGRFIDYPVYQYDYYVLKYDVNGVLLWKSVFNAIAYDNPRDLCIAGNNICVTGQGGIYPNSFLCATVLNSGGVVQWQNTSSLYSGSGSVYMPVITDGTYFYVGSDIQAGGNNYIEMKKFGDWGSVQWTFTNDTISSIRCLAYDYVNGRIVLGGNERNGSNDNLYTAEINSNTGVKVWGQRYSGSTAGYARDIKVRYINGFFNIYVLGSVSAPSSSLDFTLLKYTTSGGLVWNTSYNGIHNGADVAYSLAYGGLFDFYITGDCDDGSFVNRNFALLRVSSTFSSPMLQIKELSNSTSQPEKYALEQNYPNPFNPSTAIKFALPLDNNVSIRLFDIAGKEVANILDQKMTAGYHEIEFDGNSLASGVYFYKIVAGEFIQTKKMILLK